MTRSFIEKLTKRQRQALAFGLLVLIVVVIFSLTIAPLWAVNRHYVETIDGLDQRLQILQRTAAADTDLRSQHEQLKRTLASNRHFIKSNTEALAAAKLQEIVQRIAGSKGMEVLSTQILPSRDDAGFTRVALKVRMRGSLNNTVKLFHALETGQPYLFLDNVTVRSHARRTRAIKRTGSYTEVLNLDFDLIGYMQKPS